MEENKNHEHKHEFDDADIEEMARKDMDVILNEIKMVDDFFNKDSGKSLLKDMELALMHISEQKVIRYWSTSEECFFKCLAYDGKMFSTDDGLEPYEVFESAKQANFEFFKKCLAYKWGEKNE